MDFSFLNIAFIKISKNLIKELSEGTALALAAKNKIKMEGRERVNQFPISANN